MPMPTDLVQCAPHDAIPMRPVRVGAALHGKSCVVVNDGRV